MEEDNFDPGEGTSRNTFFNDRNAVRPVQVLLTDDMPAISDKNAEYQQLTTVDLSQYTHSEVVCTLTMTGAGVPDRVESDRDSHSNSLMIEDMEASGSSLQRNLSEATTVSMGPQESLDGQDEDNGVEIDEDDESENSSSLMSGRSDSRTKRSWV